MIIILSRYLVISILAFALLNGCRVREEVVQEEVVLVPRAGSQKQEQQKSTESKAHLSQRPKPETEKSLELFLESDRKREILEPVIKQQLVEEIEIARPTTEKEKGSLSDALTALGRVEVELDEEGNPIIGYRITDKSKQAKNADRSYLNSLDENHPLREESEINGRVPRP